MARALALPIEIQSIRQGKVMKRRADFVFWVSKREMNVVVHETPRHDRDARAMRRRAQQSEKSPSVIIILKDDLLRIAAKHDMVEPGFRSSAHWHRVPPTPVGELMIPMNAYQQSPNNDSPKWFANTRCLRFIWFVNRQHPVSTNQLMNHQHRVSTIHARCRILEASGGHG